MLGRMVGEGGRGFGVERDEHPSVGGAKVEGVKSSSSSSNNDNNDTRLG